jgi:hypothetical protein
MASAPVIAVLFLLAASAAAAQQDTLSSGTFSFNFSDTKWGGELEQPARLAVISKLNSTVQSQQGDPLKLGALLLESIRFNQTEVCSSRPSSPALCCLQAIPSWSRLPLHRNHPAPADRWLKRCCARRPCCGALARRSPL